MILKISSYRKSKLEKVKTKNMQKVFKEKTLDVIVEQQYNIKNHLNPVVSRQIRGTHKS